MNKKQRQVIMVQAERLKVLSDKYNNSSFSPIHRELINQMQSSAEALKKVVDDYWEARGVRKCPRCEDECDMDGHELCSTCEDIETQEMEDEEE